jgi:hypothetical protein
MKSVIDRIYEKIIKDSNTGCWNFIGATNKEKGYGLIKIENRTVRVHRYIWWYFMLRDSISWKNFIESYLGLEVCHKCDNTICINPEHLFIGTHLDNIRDCRNKKRIVLPKIHGEQRYNAKLTESQVLEIYKMEGSNKKIAEIFCIDASLVSRIKSGESWKWLTKKKGDSLCL